jgi:hypothetical protein
VYASGPSAASHGTQVAESMSVDVEYRFDTIARILPTALAPIIRWLAQSVEPRCLWLSARMLANATITEWTRPRAAILGMAVSDRGALGGLTQFAVCSLESWLQDVDSKWRDVRVVEGARLENDCGDSRQAILKHLLS